MVNIGNDWDNLLRDEFAKPYYQNLRKFLAYEYQHATIYPDMYDIFNALRYTSYQDVKVVILGQDPYHGQGQAHGLCFSVKKGIAPPPSLLNIFNELEDDMGCMKPTHGDLSDWTKQGVLLLNTVLTVRQGQANSHANKGWEILSDEMIRLLDQKVDPMVFLLWGKNAKAKMALLKNTNHLVLTSSHPSPYSVDYGFKGCHHFSKANEYLMDHGVLPVDWQLF